jgi:hypothetical protein
MFTKTKNRNISAPENYIWVKKLNQIWRIKFESLAAYTLFFSIFSTPVLLVLMFFTNWALTTLIISWSITLPIVFLNFYLKTKISCSACGYNPSISKKTGKHINEHQIDDRLLKLENCPSCDKIYDEKNP